MIWASSPRCAIASSCFMAGRIMESGPAEQIFGEPKHPYTKGLLDSDAAARRTGAWQAAHDSGPAALARRACAWLPVRAALRIPAADLQDGSPRATEPGRPHRRLPRGQTMSAEPLLQVDDLEVHFPLKKQLFGGPQRWVKALDGVSFQLMPGETLGIVGGVGLRQVHAVPRRVAPGRADRRTDDLARQGFLASRGRANCGSSAATCRSSSRIRWPRSIRA